MRWREQKEGRQGGHLGYSGRVRPEESSEEGTAFTHSFMKTELSTFYVPGTVLGVANSGESAIDLASALTSWQTCWDD